MSGTVTITVDWTQQILQEGNGAFRKAAPKRICWLMGGWFAISSLSAFTLTDDILFMIRAQVGADIPGYGIGYRDGITSLMVAFLLFLAGLPLLNRLAVREFYRNTPYFERPWTMELSVHGIRSKGPYNTGMIEWPAFTAVVRSKSATVLSLGGGGFVPLPHAGLPDGMTPEKLMERIEVWRGAGDF